MTTGDGGMLVLDKKRLRKIKIFEFSWMEC